MELLLASSNAHKAQELNILFKDTNISVVPALEKVDVVEDGKTFQENAFKKAKAYYDKFQVPTLADDSGLVIPARPDILGVQSARYAPELDNYKDKNEKLLSELKDLSQIDREAYFACYFCCYLSPEEIYYFEGRVHGEIALKTSGSDGFGYDPIFLPTGQNGKSMAEVLDWKMHNSHRAKAALAAIKFFENYK